MIESLLYLCSCLWRHELFLSILFRKKLYGRKQLHVFHVTFLKFLFFFVSNSMTLQFLIGRRTYLVPWILIIQVSLNVNHFLKQISLCRINMKEIEMPRSVDMLQHSSNLSGTSSRKLEQKCDPGFPHSFCRIFRLNVGQVVSHIFFWKARWSSPMGECLIYRLQYFTLAFVSYPYRKHPQSIPNGLADM